MITLLRTTSMPEVSLWSSSSLMGGPLLGKHSHPKSSATPRMPSVISSASSPLALAMMWTTGCWRGWHWRTVAWQGISRRMRTQPATWKGLFCFVCPCICIRSCGHLGGGKSSKGMWQDVEIYLRLSSGWKMQGILRNWDLMFLSGRKCTQKLFPS